MLVLPIKSIREEDGPAIGQDLLNLARLAWFDLGVAPGIIVTPPTMTIRTILEHFQIPDGEVFEQRLTLVKKEILSIRVPEELERSLSHRKIDVQKLWHYLLEFWLNQLRSVIWREGFSPQLLESLSAQPVFFTAKIQASGSCFFDYDRNLAIFETRVGTLTESQKQELEELVKKADKKLFLPQVYDWIVEKGIHIVKLTPVTDYPEIEDIEQSLPQGYQEPKIVNKSLKSTIKIFLYSDDSLKIGQGLDGVLIDSKNIKDHDQKLLQLVEFASSSQQVIFKLFDDPSAPVRGSLNLIHKTDLLKQEVEIFQFARNKKHLANVSLAVPLTRSVEEFKKIKQSLLSLGVSRNSSLKLYLELSVAENFLNLEDYLEVGFDGALLNLDQLAYLVSGFDPEGQEAVFYNQQVKALEKLLQPALKLMHQEGVSSLAYGSLALHDDLLSFLMDHGVWAIACDYINSYSIHERLRLIERRIIRSRSS